MPGLTGIDFLRWVKQNKPTPFVLMTGFAMIMETQTAHELGADDFIAKPFRDAELALVVNRVLEAKQNPELNGPSSEEDFCKVSLNEFVSAPKLQFDVFVKLGERYVKLGRKGDEFPAERIRGYRDKGLKWLHIQRADFRELVKFNMDIAKRMVTAASYDPQKKKQFFRFTGEIIMERVFQGGVDAESFDSARDFVMCTMDALGEAPSAIEMLDVLNSHSDHLYAHALCVSLYSVMIAKAMGMESSQSLFKISVCGLYHDIGKKDLPRHILEKSRPLMTVSERQLYESHALKGKEIVAAIPGMPADVAQVCAEHHEENSGSGYPAGIKKSEIHPFVQILRIADLFAELTLRRPDGAPGMAPAQALSHINLHYGEGVDRVAFKAFCDLFSKSIAA